MKKNKFNLRRLLICILAGVSVFLLLSEKQAAAKEGSDGHEPSNPPLNCNGPVGFCISGAGVWKGLPEE